MYGCMGAWMYGCMDVWAFYQLDFSLPPRMTTYQIIKRTMEKCLALKTPAWHHLSVMETHCT